MKVYVKAWSAWAPGIETKEEWLSFIKENKSLSDSAESPELPFAPSLFKRRLSQLSRMVIQTGHSVAEHHDSLKITFASVYGEISQQLQIAKKLLDTHQVSPAAFSLSVFNAPVAALSILDKNTAGYTALFPGKDAFRLGLLDAAAAIQSGSDEERLFIYADEYIPEEYRSIISHMTYPFSLALVLTKKQDESIAELPSSLNQYDTALSFLKDLLVLK